MGRLGGHFRASGGLSSERGPNLRRRRRSEERVEKRGCQKEGNFACGGDSLVCILHPAPTTKVGARPPVAMVSSLIQGYGFNCFHEQDRLLPHGVSYTLHARSVVLCVT